MCVGALKRIILAAIQDECGNRVEAQECHQETLRISVTSSVKEDGEASQVEELQADAQVHLVPPALYELTRSNSLRIISFMLSFLVSPQSPSIWVSCNTGAHAESLKYQIALVYCRQVWRRAAS